jgi:hypothetical protein
MFAASSTAMVSQLEAELAERRADSPMEPLLPAPRKDSDFAALANR